MGGRGWGVGEGGRREGRGVRGTEGDRMVHSESDEGCPAKSSLRKTSRIQSSNN